MIRCGEMMMKNFMRMPSDYKNLIVGLVAVLILALLWGASSLARNYAPQARAEAQATQLQAQEQAQREALERATVLQARWEARARWQTRIEAARAVAQIGAFAATVALLGCGVVAFAALLGVFVVKRAQLPAYQPLPDRAILLRDGVFDPRTGAGWVLGVARDPQLVQAQALAALYQARGLARREALPRAWQEVREIQALAVETG